LRNRGIVLSTEELETVFAGFDRQNKGVIDYVEFVNVIKVNICRILSKK